MVRKGDVLVKAKAEWADRSRGRKIVDAVKIFIGVSFMKERD
jgi:hypothetical protein